jgi:hypothetical protein
LRRLRAAAALLLTTFFAVAGSFHHHPIPRPVHDHAGFCSAASNGVSFESCALCKVAKTAAHLAPLTIGAAPHGAASLLAREPVRSLGAGRSLLRDSRAPPIV